MKIIRKVAFLYLMLIMVGFTASLNDPPVPPGTCTHCESFPEGSQQYYDCLEECENAQVPLDNSILYLLFAGTALASYILLKKPNHKKTPM